MNQPMPPSVAFAGTLSLEEFGRIQKAILPRWARWYVTVPILAIAVFCSVGPTTDPTLLLVDLGVLAIVLLAMRLTVRRVQARTWKQSVRLVGRVHGAITPEGIEWNSERSTSRYEWARITEVRRAGDLTLAFYAPRCAFYFPRSFFDSQASWDAFNAAITAYAGP